MKRKSVSANSASKSSYTVPASRFLRDVAGQKQQLAISSWQLARIPSRPSGALFSGRITVTYTHYSGLTKLKLKLRLLPSASAGAARYVYSPG